MTPRTELLTRGVLAFSFVVEYPCARQFTTVRAASFRPYVVYYFAVTGKVYRDGFFRALQTPAIYIQRQLPRIVFSVWVWYVFIHSSFLLGLHILLWLDTRGHLRLPHSGHVVAIHFLCM